MSVTKIELAIVRKDSAPTTLPTTIPTTLAEYVGEKSPPEQIWTNEQILQWCPVKKWTLKVFPNKEIMPKVSKSPSKSRSKSLQRKRRASQEKDKKVKIGRFRFCPAQWAYEKTTGKIKATKVLPARWIKVMLKDTFSPPRNQELVEERLFPTRYTAPSYAHLPRRVAFKCHS